MVVKDRLEYLQNNVFISGPGDKLCKEICATLIKVPQFKKLFANEQGVVAYEKDDFSFRMLPAMRCYSPRMKKETESHYINGDVHIDLLFPPSIRREEAQIFQDILSSAMLQQFRSPAMFAELRQVVPGLNELGKTFDIDKTLGMVIEQQLCPVTKIVLNFRIDQKEWDVYLEREGRTKDQPFEVTLGDLRLIASEIWGVNDDGTLNVNVPIDQQIGGTS